MPPLSHYAFDILARNVLSSDPPARRTRETNHATLLVSWWCTIFALVIILLRLSGRWVRSETLFREDKVVAISIIPLMLRMGCAHVLRGSLSQPLTYSPFFNNKFSPFWHEQCGFHWH